MRRALLAVTLSGILLTGSACSKTPNLATGGKTPTSAPTAAAPASAPAAAPGTDSSETKADTKRICDEFDKVIEPAMNGFGQKLGVLLVQRGAKNDAEAKKAQGEAKNELVKFADQITEKTAAAKDPALKAAGEESAANIKKSAGSDEFYNNIKDVSSLEKDVQNDFMTWFLPLASLCG